MNHDDLLRLFPSHRGRLLAALSRLVGPAEAEDIAQETLLRALTAVEDFRGNAALGTWLHRIAINLAYDHLRRRRKEAPPSADAEDAEEDDVVERRQMSRCVQELVASLPASQRQLLIRADVLERTAAEIARDDGISTGNAKIRLHRARRALKALLDDRCDVHRCEGGILCCSPKPAQAVSLSGSHSSNASANPARHME